MPAFYEIVMNQIGEFVTLGEVFDGKGNLIPEIDDLKNHYIVEIEEFEILQYSVIDCYFKQKNPNKFDIEYAGKAFLGKDKLSKISKYLNKENFTIIPFVSPNDSHPVGYTFDCENIKEKRRKDIIWKIKLSITGPMSFSNIKERNFPEFLKKLNIRCSVENKINDIYIEPDHYIEPIDLFDYWDKFKDDDRITLIGEIEPKVKIKYFTDDIP